MCSCGKKSCGECNPGCGPGGTFLFPVIDFDAALTTIEIGDTITGAPGTDASVVNIGTPTAPILEFTIPEGQPGPIGPPGTGNFADFYALMPGDNAAPVAVGAAVQFPQLGPTAGTDITPLTASTFQLASIGTYRIYYQVSVSEAGQLVLLVNGVPYAPSAAGRATGTSPISNLFRLTTTVVNTVVSLNNPAGNPAALTITPIAGGTIPVSAHLDIERVA